MGITKNLDKLGVFVLIIIAMTILSSGCTSKSEIAPNETAVSMPAPTITSTPTATLTADTPKVAKLKIMSVTIEPVTLGGTPVIIKVKNIGNSIAKDVYAGGITIKHIGSWEMYPTRTALINQTVHDVLINGSFSIDTGFVYNVYLFGWNEIPGNEIGLRSSLKEYFGIDWLEGAKIEKINNGNTIRLTNGKRNLSLIIDNDITKINIEIDGVRMDEFLEKRQSAVIYTTNTSRFGGLIVSGTSDTKDYLGDILPDETKTAQFTRVVDSEYIRRPYLYSYINVAWIDDTKEFTIY